MNMALKKVSKKYRKPLTEEQREKATQNLVKARAAKAPSKNLSIHESVRELPDTHPVSLKKVKNWINVNKEERDSLRTQLRVKYDKKLNNRYNILNAYVLNMEAYLRTGTWLDLFYGQNQEYKVKHVKWRE